LITGTISFTGEETGDTGFALTPVFYTTTYTQPPGGPITASFTDTTVGVPGPVVGTGLPRSDFRERWPSRLVAQEAKGDG